MASSDEPKGPLPPVPGGVRVEVVGSIAAIPVVNFFHVHYAGSPPGQADLHNFCLLVGDSWIANFMPLLCQDYTLLSVDATDISSITGATGTETFSQLGSVTTPVSSNNVALVVSWKANTRYRGGHPRTYFSGLPAASSNGPAFWDAVVVGNWATAAQKFLSDVNAAGLGAGGQSSLVCVHYFRHHLLLSPPEVEPITGVGVSLKKRSQRRRLIK